MQTDSLVKKKKNIRLVFNWPITGWVKFLLKYNIKISQNIVTYSGLCVTYRRVLDRWPNFSHTYTTCYHTLRTTSLLHRNGSSSIVACMFTSRRTCLPSHCLAWNVYYGSAIPAFRHHVTISSPCRCIKITISELVITNKDCLIMMHTDSILCCISSYKNDYFFKLK
jgi:hypothetical protein